MDALEGVFADGSVASWDASKEIVNVRHLGDPEQERGGPGALRTSNPLSFLDLQEGTQRNFLGSKARRISFVWSGFLVIQVSRLNSFCLVYPFVGVSVPRVQFHPTEV